MNLVTLAEILKKVKKNCKDLLKMRRVYRGSNCTLWVWAHEMWALESERHSEYARVLLKVAKPGNPRSLNIIWCVVKPTIQEDCETGNSENHYIQTSVH